MGPSLRGSSEANQLGWGSVERTGNVLHAEIPVYSPGTPAGGVPVVASGGPLLEGSLALSKDGAEIGHTADPVTGDWTLPSGAGDYTLDLTAKRTAPQLALNTGVRTRWTFRSEEGQPLPPLLTLDSRLPGLDLRNSAAATGTTPLSIQVVRQDSAAADVASVRVWVSAGDAGQWTEVRAVRAGDRWAAALPGGTAGQFVSLRVAATDRGGSAVDQTVTRAYRLR
jgi:hypothetical protein